jgi:cysteine desulfurase / selenocysteine lyase
MDLERIRADTPAAGRQRFLLSAGSSLMPRQVVDAMVDHLRLEEEIGGYAAADREQERCDAVYDSVARLLNASRDEIALVENATVGWQMAFYALPFRPGERILTAQAEYAANYVAYLQVAKRTGAVIEVVPNDSSGQLDTAALRDMIDERVKLISITWVPTNGGLTNPATEIGAIAREHGIPYLLDACQAVGQMPVDVERIGCDMLAATGRKFLRGPRGTGFLYVRRALLEQLEPPVIDHFAAPWTAKGEYKLRDDARRFENWENNYAGRLGLGVAAEYALAIGLPEIEERCRLLSDRLRQGLTAAGAVVHDLGRWPCAIVSFTVPEHPAEEVVREAARRRIVLGVSGPASTRLDAEARNLPPIVRASPHYFNVESDVDALVQLCRELCRP